MTTKNVNGNQVEMSVQEESDFIAESDANVLPSAIASKVGEIKAEALARMKQEISIDDFDQIEVLKEFWLSIAPAARQPTTKWQWVIDVWQSGKDAVGVINALADAASVQAYDAITDPNWPA